MEKSGQMKDANLSYLNGKIVAILGYGNQGSDHAQKLRDSGIRVIVALREGTSWNGWKEDDFEVLSVWEAVDKADIIQVW
jgi:ketol-acid reductoisomerase